MKGLCFVLFLIPFIFSCQSKEEYIDDYKEFIREVEASSISFDNDAWQEYDALFIDFSEKKYDKFFDDLTEDEIIELSKLNSIYLGKKMSITARDTLIKLRNE